MKSKLYVALLAFVASMGVSVYSATALTAPVAACSGCAGGNTQCCKAHGTGDIYYMP